MLIVCLKNSLYYKFIILILKGIIKSIFIKLLYKSKNIIIIIYFIQIILNFSEIVD